MCPEYTRFQKAKTRSVFDSSMGCVCVWRAATRVVLLLQKRKKMQDPESAKRTLAAVGRKLHVVGAVQLSLAIIPLFFDFGFVSNILSIASGCCAVCMGAGRDDAVARGVNNVAIRGL